MLNARADFLVSISLSSGFSFQATSHPRPAPACRFQSRYRAASHFRALNRFSPGRLLLRVSISLSSGFSFQGDNACVRAFANRVSISLSSGFSFQVSRRLDRSHSTGVSISLSSGFSFQAIFRILCCGQLIQRFNLVIERLLISGRRAVPIWSAPWLPVSISLSSGFSFQASAVGAKSLSR